ncbi:MAG: NUDIX hydrolase [Corynebacterium sp.]|nr:NUDIX hydrolase [Corynebacterium sp.]
MTSSSSEANSRRTQQPHDGNRQRSHRRAQGQSNQNRPSGNGSNNNRNRHRSNRNNNKNAQGNQGQQNKAAQSKNPANTNAGNNAGNNSASGNKGGNRNSKRGNNRNSNNRNRRRNPQGQKRNNKARPQNGAKRRQPRMPVSNETSAGGMVISGLAEAVNAKGEVDLDRIYAALIGRVDRRGRLLWSMPKGHVEQGEKYARTAEREVWEETGIHGTVFTRIGSIDYWFVSDGVRIHKSVYHYLLRYQDGVFNDEDPEVTEVAWFPVTELTSKLAYADERKLARTALEKLPQFARQEKAAGRVTPR